MQDDIRGRSDFDDSRGRNRLWLIASLGVCCIVLVSNWRFLAGIGYPVHDADAQFAPWQMLIGDYAQAGRFLLWNPWSSGGSPDYADPQYGAFSPVTVLLGAIFGGTLTGFLAYWLLLWTIAGVGMVLLCRHLGAPPWGAFVITLGFLFSGFFTGHAQHVSNIYALAWLPWIIWRLDEAVVSGRLWPAVEAGALWGVSALAGYPALVMLTAGYAFLWVMGRIFCLRVLSRLPAGNALSDRGIVGAAPLGRLLLAILLFGAIGILILSPSYLAFLIEGRGFTGRVEELPRSLAVESNALHPAALSTLTSPYLGTLWFYNNRQFWDYTDGSSNSIYTGVIVLWLALAALMLAPKNVWRLWLLGLVLLSIALAMGRAMPFRGWLYDLFPPSRFFRHPAIFRDYAIFSLAALAIEAIKDIQARLQKLHHSRRHVVVLTGVVAISAVSVFVLVLCIAPSAGRPALVAGIHAAGMWAATCLLAWFLFQTGIARRNALFKTALMALAVADAFASYEANRWTIFQTNPKVSRDWQAIAFEHKPELSIMLNGWDRCLQSSYGPGLTNKNLPLKTPVLNSYTPFQSSFLLSWLEQPLLISSATGLERTWFAPTALELPLTDQAFTAFTARAQKLKAVPLVIQDPQKIFESPADKNSPLDPTVRRGIEQLPPAELVRDIQLLAYLPERLSFTLQSAADGWLLVTDRWSSGWHVRVNGVLEKIWMGNFLFRAVRVKSGRNDVEFTYQAFGFPYLLIMSWGLLFLILLGTVYSAIGRIRNACIRSRGTPSLGCSGGAV